MKKLLLGILLLSATSAFAGVDIQIGKGAWICSSEGIKDYPTLARATSRAKAKYLAQQKCANYEGSEFHCEVEECVKDKNSKNINVDINFSIDRDGSNVFINLNNGQSGFICTSEAFSSSYMAEAPTRLEAEVLARQTCIEDSYHGMHCDIEECEKVESDGVSGSIGPDGIDIEGAIRGLGGLFGRND